MVECPLSMHMAKTYLLLTATCFVVLFCFFFLSFWCFFLSFLLTDSVTYAGRDSCPLAQDHWLKRSWQRSCCFAVLQSRSLFHSIRGKVLCHLPSVSKIIISFFFFCFFFSFFIFTSFFSLGCVTEHAVPAYTKISTSSRRVVGSNPIWASPGFFPSLCFS